MAERVEEIPPYISPAPRGGIVRDGNGHFITTPDHIKRGEEVCRLRSQGLPWRVIAERVGFNDPSSAFTAYRTAIAKLPSTATNEARTTELEHLDFLRRTVVALLDKQYITVSAGRVVYFGDDPIEDTGPILAAVDRLLKIESQIADLHGLKSPSSIVVGAQVNYIIEGVEMGNV